MGRTQGQGRALPVADGVEGRESPQQGEDKALLLRGYGVSQRNLLHAEEGSGACLSTQAFSSSG